MAKMSTYVSAGAIEKRLDGAYDELIKEYPEGSDSYNDALNGFNVAADCITCYRDVGGDIWKGTDELPEIGQDIILSVKDTGDDGLMVLHGVYQEDGYHSIGPLPESKGELRIYAWAPMPEAAD